MKQFFLKTSLSKAKTTPPLVQQVRCSFRSIYSFNDDMTYFHKPAFTIFSLLPKATNTAIILIIIIITMMYNTGV